jgi:hypothetical protein
LLFLGLGTPSARADLLWQATPTASDVGRWDRLQSAAPYGYDSSPDRIAPSSSPVPGEKKQVIRITLRAGDVAWNPRGWRPVAMGNRSEMVHLPYVSEGDERWYHWRVFFPRDFAVTDGKKGGAVFVQWHHWNQTGEPGSPPLLFSARTGDIQLISVPELNSEEAITIASVPQQKGRWRDFLFHVRFSSDPRRALSELWVDHRPVRVEQKATLFPGYSNYLKMGLYRRPTAREDNVIYFDEIAEGTSRRDVEVSEEPASSVPGRPLRTDMK